MIFARESDDWDDYYEWNRWYDYDWDWNKRLPPNSALWCVIHNVFLDGGQVILNELHSGENDEDVLKLMALI